MASLVQIPWQRTLWLTPKTLDRLIDAVGILGRQIYLNGPDAGWRSEARQEYLWDSNGHDPAKANSPWVGQRAHMKGGGLDVPTDKATRDAMIAAGFRPDANELWHFNAPDIAFMPIIKTNTAAASSGSSPIFDSLQPPVTPPPPPTTRFQMEEEDDMPLPVYASGNDPVYGKFVYACYINTYDTTVPLTKQSAGPVWISRRSVHTGELALINARKAAGLTLWPGSDQKDILVMKQADFDSIPVMPGGQV